MIIFVYEYCIYTILPHLLFPPINSSCVLPTPFHIHGFIFCNYNSYIHICVYVYKFINTPCWDHLVFRADIFGLASLSRTGPWRRLILPLISAIKPVAVLLWVKPCEIFLCRLACQLVFSFLSPVCATIWLRFPGWSFPITLRRHYLTAGPIPLALRSFLPSLPGCSLGLRYRDGILDV